MVLPRVDWRCPLSPLCGPPIAGFGVQILEEIGKQTSQV